MSNYARCCSCGGDADTDAVVCQTCDSAFDSKKNAEVSALRAQLAAAEEVLVERTVERDSAEVGVKELVQQLADTQQANRYARDECNQMEQRAARAERERDEARADATIAHRWFAEQFGEIMNGRDFAVKCPMADEELAEERAALARIAGEVEKDGTMMLPCHTDAVNIAREALGMPEIPDVAAPTSAARLASLEKVAEAAHKLSVELMDQYLVVIRQCWGNTNASVLERKRQAVRDALAALQPAESEGGRV